MPAPKKAVQRSKAVLLPSHDADWASTPEGKRQIEDIFRKTRKMDDRLQEKMQLDRRKLDEPVTL